MKYSIEISRGQHTTIEVKANSLDDAISQAETMYSNGDIPDCEWYDYEDGVEYYISAIQT